MKSSAVIAFIAGVAIGIMSIYWNPMGYSSVAEVVKNNVEAADQIAGSHEGHLGHHRPIEENQAEHPFIVQMNIDMNKMMSDMHAPGYSGNWDVDFLAMMIPHHQGAIDMAKLVLVHGQDPLTRTLAEEIIASQQVEINAMNARLDTLRSPKYGAKEYPALSGTRGTE